ncbi:MAG TPA: tetratricopeptide repeat protein [Candidatus Krumholzibacteria bacterium]|nr:tetratricopeptide repeat protein [Candidatus Krumholzibacteria bacterium]
MKICPFMSHMLGNEPNVLEVGSSEDDLGHGEDSHGGVGVKSSRATGVKESKPAASHLYCLRDTCRFYRSKDGDCTFDAILESANRAGDSAAAVQKEASSSIARELDKFWKFQTKSAAELISSFGEVEKRQEESLAKIAHELENKITERKSDDESLGSLRDGIANIKDTMEARNEGFETLSTSVSDLVLGFEDSIKSIKDQWTTLTGQLAALEALAPRIERMESGLTKTVENIDRLERNWAEMMDVVRTRSEAEKKKAEDTVAEKQGNRREAMKFNNLGVTSFHNGHLELARDQFLDAVKRDPSFAECFNNLGLVYTDLGEEAKAAAAFLKAIKLSPDLHAAYNNLGYVYYKQGNYEKAIEMHQEAVSRSASNSSAYTNLGNAHFKMGHKDEARHAWKKAIELDPANEKAQRSLKTLGE